MAQEKNRGRNEIKQIYTRRTYILGSYQSISAMLFFCQYNSLKWSSYFYQIAMAKNLLSDCQKPGDNQYIRKH